MNRHKNLRIVFVTDNYTPYGGGVVSSIDAFCDELHMQGHEVLIITLDFLGKKHNDPPHVVRVPSFFHCVWNKNILAAPWRPTAHLLKIARQFNPDVIHTHHPFLLGVSALKVSQILSVPIVFTYHTMYEHYIHYVPFYKPLVRFVVKKRVVRFCKKVDHIIAPSSTIRDYIVSSGVQTSISIIPSPINKRFLASTYRSSPLKGNLLLVTRLVKEKNIPFVLNLIKKLDQKRYNLTIVGYGPQEEELRSYAYQALGLTTQQVKFIIKPPKHELVSQYQKADLFLFPSTSDTQGLVLAEAMAGGTPVIALDGPGQRDIIKNGYNGFIVADEAQMIEKIHQIFDHPELHKVLEQGALDTAKQYQPEVLTKRLIELYEGLRV